jgi:hypothetical protein
LELSSGSSQRAKQYFTEAASSTSPAGRQARAALLRLDFPRYAGEYIQIQIGLNNDGYVLARINNQAPLGIKDLQLTIQYPDTSGKTLQTTRRFRAVIPAGQSYDTNLNLGPYADAAILNAIRIQITSAVLMEK